MFAFDLQCWFLNTDGFNCGFAGMMSSALRKTISTFGTQYYVFVGSKERLVGVEMENQVLEFCVVVFC